MSKKGEPKKKKLSDREKRDLEIEIAFIKGVVDRDPEFEEALEVLSQDYTRCGNLDESLAIDEKLAHLHPEDPNILYNLACRYAMTRHVRQAVATLKRALLCGFDDFRLLTHDPDLENIRQSSSYKKLLRENRA